MPFQSLPDQIEVGAILIQIGKVFNLDAIVQAHRRMESNQAGGQIVLVNQEIQEKSMKQTALWTAAAVVTLAFGTVTLADEGGGSRTTVLLKATSSWNDVKYNAYPAGQPELTTLRMTIPANSTLHWHKHLMPNTAYIISGELTVEERGTGRKATYHAGQSLAESVNDVHRGVTGKEPVVLIVTYAGAQGQPLSVPASDDNNADGG